MFVGGEDAIRERVAWRVDWVCVLMFWWVVGSFELKFGGILGVVWRVAFLGG